jgi:hypothetical protein
VGVGCVRSLFTAQAGEVLLVDLDSRTSRGAATTTTFTARAITTSTTATSTTTTASSGTVATATGLLNEAHVDFEEVLLLALSLALALFFLRLDVVLLLAVAFEFLGGLPFLVLAACVGGTGFLHAEFAATLSSLLSEIVGIGLGLVGFLDSGSLAAFERSLRFGLLSFGDGFTGLFVVPLGIALLSTPALSDLLLGVTCMSLAQITNRKY